MLLKKKNGEKKFPVIGRKLKNDRFGPRLHAKNYGILMCGFEEYLYCLLSDITHLGKKIEKTQNILGSSSFKVSKLSFSFALCTTKSEEIRWCHMWDLASISIKKNYFHLVILALYFALDLTIRWFLPYFSKRMSRVLSWSDKINVMLQFLISGRSKIWFSSCA